MKLIKFDEAAANVRKSMDNLMSDEQIGHINDKLLAGLYNFNIEGGMSHTIIHQNDIPGGEDVPLKLLARLLSAAGWNATHMSDLGYGERIHISLRLVVK